MTTPPPNDSDRKRDPLWALIAEHPALAITAAAAVIVIIKPLVAARLDTSTAVAIATTASPADVALGTAIHFWPSLLTLAAVGLGWWFVRLAGQDEPHWLVAFFTLFAAMATLFLVPFVYLAVLTFAAVLEVFSARRWKRKGGTPESRGDILGRYIFPLILTALLASDWMWVPKESVTVQGETYLGYVIGTEDGWVSVLRDEDRVLVRATIAEVDRGRLCAPETYMLSLFDLFRPRPPNPVCER